MQTAKGSMKCLTLTVKAPIYISLLPVRHFHHKPVLSVLLGKNQPHECSASQWIAALYLITLGCRPRPPWTQTAPAPFATAHPSHRR